MMLWLCLALNLNSFGCNSLEVQKARLEGFVKDHPFGSSRDVWLVKQNFFGQYEKVALVFGFVNDYEFCDDVAQLYMRKYPNDRYMCVPQF